MLLIPIAISHRNDGYPHQMVQNQTNCMVGRKWVRALQQLVFLKNTTRLDYHLSDILILLWSSKHVEARLILAKSYLKSRLVFKMPYGENSSKQIVWTEAMHEVLWRWEQHTDNLLYLLLRREILNVDPFMARKSRNGSSLLQSCSRSTVGYLFAHARTVCAFCYRSLARWRRRADERAVSKKKKQNFTQRWPTFALWWTTPRTEERPTKRRKILKKKNSKQKGKSPAKKLKCE